jgi:hypothetical protein
VPPYYQLAFADWFFSIFSLHHTLPLLHKPTIELNYMGSATAFIAYSMVYIGLEYFGLSMIWIYLIGGGISLVFAQLVPDSPVDGAETRLTQQVPA